MYCLGEEIENTFLPGGVDRGLLPGKRKKHAKSDWGNSEEIREKKEGIRPSKKKKRHEFLHKIKTNRK